MTVTRAIIACDEEASLHWLGDDIVPCNAALAKRNVYSETLRILFPACEACAPGRVPFRFSAVHVNSCNAGTSRILQ